MKAATREAIGRRTARCSGWLLCAVLVAGCSSAGSGPTASTTPGGSPAGDRSATARVSAEVHGTELAVSGTVPRARLQEVARDARTAVTRVRQVWGDSVLSGRVRIEVAADTADFRRRGGSAEAGSQIAATTTSDDRVVLAPSLFTRVTAPGRVVVLTHELTHVALHRTGGTDIRRWIVEGAAEFTAYRATHLGLSRLAPQLAGDVRSGHPPAGPPNDARFVSAPVSAYQEAYAWCAFLVGRFGLARFTRFVRSASSDHAESFAAVFGVSAGSLREPFAAQLRREVAAGGTPSTGAG